MTATIDSTDTKRQNPTPDGYLTLYDKDKNPSVGVQLTKEGIHYWQNGGRDLSQPGLVSMMLDLKRIALAEF